MRGRGPMKLEGKVALVTGAGRGIGKAIALAFAGEGADLVVVSRTPAEVKTTAGEIRALGRRALPLEVDVSQGEAVDTMIRQTIAEFGKIDVLVNNAGIYGPIGPLVDNDSDRWIETIRINLIGVYLCTRAVLPAMMAQRQGKIINLAGGGAASPRPYFSAYSTAKAGVVRFTETVAEEVKQYNIHINAISPGGVSTRLVQEVVAAGEAAGEKDLNEARHIIETGGGPPSVAASLAVFLASPDSDGLTGRLLSATWDDWRGMAGHIPEIMASDLYTLRRVVPQ